MVSSESPCEHPPPPLQLLLSSQQQLLCSCRYALCNECYCVRSPQAGVVDAKDNMLCLCHFKVSHSSLSGKCVIYHRIINMFNSNIFIFGVIYTLWMVHQICINTREKKMQITKPLVLLLGEFSYKWNRGGELWARVCVGWTLLNELLIDSAEMSSVSLIIIHFFYSTLPN